VPAPAAAAPWVVWALLRATGTERGFPLVPAMSFTPYAAVTAVVPLAVAARERSAPGAALSAGAAAVLAAAVLSRSRSRRAPLPGGPRIRVATVSLRRGLVRPGPVLELVSRYAVDVLAVQELTPEAETALRAAGLDRLLPSAHVVPARPGAVPAASGAVWTRLPVVGRSVTRGVFEQPAVRLDAGGGAVVELTSVHTFPPATSPASVRAWSSDLRALPAAEPGVLRVLAGDFNATLDHAALRAAVARGYRDAARDAGRALAWTWRPLRLRVPRLTIDHVLLDPRVGVASVETVRVEGSDHRALVAELALPG